MTDETNPTDPMAELSAMKTVAEAVARLDQGAAARVLRWAAERFGVALPIGGKAAMPPGRAASTSGPASNGESSEVPQFESLAELHAAATPATDADRALVAGYWLQFMQGEAEFGSQSVNTALKDLGHGVTNITGAFDTLKGQKPALVIQLKKAGTTKQARKTYKLTAAGKSAVEMMIGQQH